MSVTINGSAGVTTNSGAVYNGIASGTAVSASGTSVDFTGIPSWVKRITVMLSGVSTSGTSIPIIQLGITSGIEATGYAGVGSAFINGSSTGVTSQTTGFGITDSNAAAYAYSGNVILNLLNNSTNLWVASGVIYSNRPVQAFTSGNKSLAGALDRIRITTVNGTDTFDAGSINILYE
jgi:hypothetical protein